MDLPYSPSLQYMDTPNTPNNPLGMMGGGDQTPQQVNQSIPTFTFYSSRTPYAGEQNLGQSVPDDRAVSPGLMYNQGTPIGFQSSYNQFPFNTNFIDTQSPAPLMHPASYNPLDIQFTSEFMAHNQAIASPQTLYPVASAPAVANQSYQSSSQTMSTQASSHISHLRVSIPPPSSSMISKHHKRTADDLENGSTSIKQESVTIASFEAPVFNVPRSTPSITRPLSSESSSNSSNNSLPGMDTSSHTNPPITIPSSANHIIRSPSPPSRSGPGSRSSRRGRGSGQPRQRYDSLEERQIHRKQKHREMDALRRQKETAVVERFAVLSNQMEEKIEEKRDRVTTLEVACDRYAQLIEQFEEQRKQLAASQEQCKKLEAQLALTRGVAFDSNFETLMSAHELGTMNDVNARENALIISTLKACPPNVANQDAVSPATRQQNLLERMTSYYHSHTLYSSIIWNSSMMIMVISLSSARFLDCSQAFLDRAGWSRENLIGKVFFGVHSVMSGLTPLPEVHYDFADRPPMRTQDGAVVPAPFFSDQLAGTKKEIARLWRGEAESVSCVFRMFFSMGSYEVRCRCWLGQGGQEVDMPDPSPESIANKSANSSSAGLEHELQRMGVHKRKRKMPLELIMTTSSVDIVDMSS